MLKEGLVVRVERKYKRPKPGRTRLVKWPRTVLQMEVNAQGEEPGHVIVSHVQ